MTNTQLAEMLSLYEKSDEEKKQIIYDLLLCSVSFGEPFNNEIILQLDSGNKQGTLEVIAKYKAILGERETA